MSQPTDEIVIPLSKTKLILTVLGSLAFVGIGIWLLTIDTADISQGRSFRLFFNNPLFARTLGVGAIVFFGVVGAYTAKKFFDKKPGLILDSTGFTDNASAASAGFVPWSEVAGFDIFQMNRTKMLVILVADPEKYIQRGGAVRQKLNKANFNMCGSPITISSTTLDSNFAELQSLFTRYLTKYARPSAETS